MADIFEIDFPYEPVYSGELAQVVMGLPGRPGTSGGAVYEHTQAAPADVWTVPHNLGRKPSVTVTDHLGATVYADVVFVDDDIVRVTHGAPLAGYAYCN